MVFLLFFRNLYTLIYEQAVKEFAIDVDLDYLDVLSFVVYVVSFVL